MALGRSRGDSKQGQKLRMSDALPALYPGVDTLQERWSSPISAFPNPVIYLLNSVHRYLLGPVVEAYGYSLDRASNTLLFL